MAQSGSCPNPDLSNGATVHNQLGICSDLETQIGRGDEEGEKEDEEVELAEEVGEDVLMMAEAGEEQAEREIGQHVVKEEVRIIQVALLPNGLIKKGEEGESETLEENELGGAEVQDKEQKEIHEETRTKEGEDRTKEESKGKHAVGENQCHFSDRNKDNEEDRGVEEYETDIAIPETDVMEEPTDKGDNGFEKHQTVSATNDPENVDELSFVVEESVTDTQLSTDNTTETEFAFFSTNGELTETTEGPTTYYDSNTTGIDEEIPVQHDQCQISTVPINSIEFPNAINQTNQLVSENLEKIKNTGEKDSSKQEAESINNTKWQQIDTVEAKIEVEGTNELVKDVQSASDAALDIEGETNLEVAQPQLASVPPEAQSQTEGEIEETRFGGINHKAQEEEQVRQVGVNTLTATDGGGNSTEEECKASDNVVSESMSKEEHRGRSDKEMQEESIVQDENQAMVSHPELAVQFVEEVPLDPKQDVDLDQVEEAYELVEQGENQREQTEDEVTSAEKKSTTEGGDFQEHPTQFLKETGTDRDQQRNQIILEHERGGEALEEEIVEEVEMAEEPVTVLDDDIEEVEERETSEPADMMTVPSEDARMEAKDEKSQKLEVMKMELDKVRDEKQKDEKGHVVNEKKPEDVIRDVELDINGKVKELRKAMENGILCPEPQQLTKEVWGTARMRSPRRKDSDWIKTDQPEDNREPEMKDWRKELKPVKKDIWENERGRKEWAKKDPSPEKKSLPKNEDWIKELKSVIKDESLPKKKDEQAKKKRVVLLEDGHSYFPQRDETTEEKREDVKLVSHRRAESPLPHVRRNSKTPQDQDYEISLYVKVKNTHIQSSSYYVQPQLITLHIRFENGGFLNRSLVKAMIALANGSSTAKSPYEAMFVPIDQSTENSSQSTTLQFKTMYKMTILNYLVSSV